MIVKMKSMFSHLSHQMDLDITEEQWRIWNGPNPPNVQDLFPNLTDDEREFLMTGSTPEEWEEYVGVYDDEDWIPEDEMLDKEDWIPEDEMPDDEAF